MSVGLSVHRNYKASKEPDFSFSGQGQGHVTLKIVHETSQNGRRELRFSPFDSESKINIRLNEDIFSPTNIFAARGAFHHFYLILPPYITSLPTKRMESIKDVLSDDVHS